MRIFTLMLAGLLVGSMSAPSVAGADGRSVEKRYTITRGHLQLNSQEVAWMGSQAEQFRARAGERSVRISLEDDTGNPARGRVEVNGDIIQFCSTTEKPIRVQPGDKINVHAVFGSCGNALAVVTEGTITATFSK